MIRFIENKDLILRRMINVEKKKEEDLIIANMKDNVKNAYFVEPFLDEKSLFLSLEKLKGYETCSLVVYNTGDNLSLVVKNWDRLAKFKKNFSINFINPFSRTEKRWAVYPLTHELVAEKPKIKKSLDILFANVEATTKEEIERILKEQ